MWNERFVWHDKEFVALGRHVNKSNRNNNKKTNNCDIAIAINIVSIWTWIVWLWWRLWWLHSSYTRTCMVLCCMMMFSVKLLLLFNEFIIVVTYSYWNRYEYYACKCVVEQQFVSYRFCVCGSYELCAFKCQTFCVWFNFIHHTFMCTFKYKFFCCLLLFFYFMTQCALVVWGLTTFAAFTIKGYLS